MSQNSHSLWQALSQAVGMRRPGAAVRLQLQSALQSWKAGLLKAGEVPARSEAARREVEDSVARGGLQLRGRFTRVNAAEAQAALTLSERLQVLETDALAAVKAARPGQDLLAGAQQAFFQERYYVLASLSLLLKARGDDSLSGGLRALLVAFTNELLVEGLAERLMRQVQALGVLARAPAAAAASAASEFQAERLLLGECVFFIAYQSRVQAADATQLLELLLQTAREEPQPAELLAQLALAMLALLSPEQAALPDPRTNEPGESLLREPACLRRLEDLLAAPDWPARPPLRPALLLALRAFRAAPPPAREAEGEERLPAPAEASAAADEAAAALSAALTAEAFEGLAWLLEALEGPLEADCANRPLYTGLLDELLAYLLREHPLLLRALKRREQEQEEEEEEGAFAAISPSAAAAGGAFGALLRLAARLYRDEAALAGRFFDAGDPLAGFVRLAGEGLSERQFVDFLDLLGALGGSSAGNAYACFQLLRHSGHKLLSWDHFFAAMERTYLELQAAADAPGPRLQLRAEDQAGLAAIARLLARLADAGPEAALALAEQPHWHPLESLFALLACPLPPALKAALLDAVRAFARHPHLHPKIWALLDLWQLLPRASTPPVSSSAATTPSAAAVPPPYAAAPSLTAAATTAAAGTGGSGGLRFELEEVEARLEEYPLTRAFVGLLARLLEAAPLSFLQQRLGAGGEDVYVRFVRDQVFLRLEARAYRRPEELLELYRLCFEAFLPLLEFVTLSEPPEPPRSAFPPAADLAAAFLGCPAPPALRRLLSLLRRLHLRLVAPSPAPGAMRATETRTLEVALRFLARLLRLERQLLVSSLDRALLRERDAFLSLALLVEHPAPRVACLAVRCLRELARRQGERLAVLVLEAGEAARLLQAFAACLEADEEPEPLLDHLPGPGPEAATAAAAGVLDTMMDVDMEPATALDTGATAGAGGGGGGGTEPSVRACVLRLLLEQVTAAGSAAEGTVLAGTNLGLLLLGFEAVGSSPSGELELREPPHCLAALLALLEPAQALRDLQPTAAARCLELLYRLASLPRTSRALLQYLRLAAPRFFRTQLRAQLLAMRPPAARAQLAQAQYLLLLLAIELRLAQLRGQTSHARRLLALLLLVPGEPADPDLEDDDLAATAEEAATFSAGEAELGEGGGGGGSGGGGAGELALLPLLRLLDASAGTPLPRGDEEEPAAPAVRHLAGVDLRAFLVQPREAHLRGVALVDTRALHAHLLERHARLEQAYNLSVADQAEVAREVALWLHRAADANRRTLDLHARLAFARAWLALLALALEPPLLLLPGPRGEPLLLELLAGVARRLDQSPAASDPLAAPLAEAALLLLARLRELRQGLTQAPPPDPLLQLLASLLRALVQPRTEGPLRANLYACLVNYLQLVRPPPHRRGPAWSAGLAAQEARVWTALAQGTAAQLQAHGERLLEVCGVDACQAEPLLCKSALAFLAQLLQRPDGADSASPPLHAHALPFLAQRGPLAFFIESSVLSPELALVSPASEQAIAAQLVYEATMAVLIRLAATEQGASLLQRASLVPRLARCSFLTAPPADLDAIERQQALLLPFLALLVALQCSLPRHAELATQIADLIAAHPDLFSALLKERIAVPAASVSPGEESPEMRLLVLVSALFERLAPHAALVWPRLAPRGAKFHTLLITAFTRHARLHDEPNGARSFSAPEVPLALLVCRNLLTYARMMSGSPSAEWRLIFAAQMDATQGVLPGLRLPIQYLERVVSQLISVKCQLEQLQFKVAHIEELSSSEIMELLSGQEQVSQSIVPSLRLHLARYTLQEHIQCVLHHELTLIYIIEHVLLLLVRHFEYYLLSSASSTTLGLQLSSSQVELLKREAASHLSHSFALLTKTRLDDPKSSPFAYALVRRLHDLLA